MSNKLRLVTLAVALAVAMAIAVPAGAHTTGAFTHTSCASPQNAVNDTGGGTDTAPGQGALPGGDVTDEIRPGNANNETPGVDWGAGTSAAAQAAGGLGGVTASAHDGCDGSSPPDGSNADD